MVTTRVLIIIVVCSLLCQPVVAAQPSSQAKLGAQNSVDDPAFAVNTQTYRARLGTGLQEGIDHWGGDRGSLDDVRYEGKRAVETDRDRGTNYIYFDVAEGDSSSVPKGAIVQVTLEYWNGRQGAFRLEYDAYGDFGTDTKVVKTTGEDGWRTARFTFNMARFDERLNNGDFRINPLNGPTDIAVRNVTVRIQTPKLGVKQHRIGNVFLTNETPRITLTRYQKPVSWTAKRFDGSVVAEGMVAAPGSNEIVVRLPLDQTGHYRVVFRDAETGRALRETSVAVLPPTVKGGYERYGVSTHYGQLWKRDLYQLKTMKLLDRAGSGTLRDGLGWRRIEQSRGEYTFPSKYDSFMRTAARHDLEPFIVVIGTNPLYDNGGTVYSDEGQRAFGEYSRVVVERYPNIEHVQVYNEFNIPRFGDSGESQADASPENYTLLLNETADHLNGTQVKLVGPATSGVPLDWIRATYERGALTHLDVISVHPYTADAPTQVDEKMASVRQLNEEYSSEDKPLWISENGWSTSKTGAGATFKEQASYLVKAHILAFSEGTDRYYTYELIDEGPDRSEHWLNFGLVHTRGDRQGSYTPKPAFTAYAVLIRTISDAPFEGEDQLGRSVESYRFENPNGEGTVRVMWRPTVWGSGTVTVRSNGPVVIKTMMGATRRLFPENGTVDIQLDSSPVYVYGLGEGSISEHVPPEENGTNTASTTESERGESSPTKSDTDSRDQPTGTVNETRTSTPGFSVLSSLLSLLLVVILAEQYRTE